MAQFLLCSGCRTRFKQNSAVGDAPNPAACHICAGALSTLPALVSSALLQSSSFEWGSFSISSSFAKKTLVREQEVADFFQPGEFTSMKNAVNSELARSISKATGKQNDARNPDAIFGFNFISGKAVAKPASIYVFGHYAKLSRQHCQSRWHSSDCGGRGCNSCGGSGRNYPSVEDELGQALLPAFGASGCTLHASGREDVDVRMLGTGRPFVMEISSPKKRKPDLQAVESSLAGSPSVRAVGLRIVGKHFLDAVCNSHFEKEYSALVSADRPLTAADAKEIESLSGQIILQQTPKRVLSRRADLERKRKIISISAEACDGGKLRLRITAEAGTYIKELISSDSGRTKPSISALLGCSAACDELDVVAIHDYFLDTVFTGAK